jgi:hypothetical protein
MRPGVWLLGLSDAATQEVTGLLSLLEGALTDAAISLGLFEEAQRAYADARQADKEVASETFFDIDRTRYDASQLRLEYARRLPFLYAKLFLYALDAILKGLVKLQYVPNVPTGVATALDKYRDALPLLKDVRNSAQHPEQRVRAKKRHEKDLRLQPVDIPGISAPHGGLVVVDGLIGNRIGGTLEDGSYGAIEVSAASLAEAVGVEQSVFDAFEWTDPHKMYHAKRALMGDDMRCPHCSPQRPVD